MLTSSYSEVSFPCMGTAIHIKIMSPQATNLLEECQSRLATYEKNFSTFLPNSQLQAINLDAGKSPVKVNPDLFELIQLGKEYSIKSQKRFNIAIGPLVKLWQVGFGGHQAPKCEDIQTCHSLIDPQQIQLNQQDQTVYLERAGMALDLGALAKGYFADQLKTFLIDEGVRSGFIDLGGNVQTIGPNFQRLDGQWYVGIQDPARGRGLNKMILKIQDQSVVTSGIYERFFENPDGQRFHHILDSVTGYPIKNSIASVTVICSSSTEAEYWTSHLFFYEPTEIMNIVEDIPTIEVIVIDRQGNISLTQGIQSHAQFL